jgi:[acyl-carrier-protein] S-malonyltransferase
MTQVDAAFLFPGQGAQKVGMGKNLYENSASAKSVFISADEALQAPLSELIFDGPQEELTLTANTQPSILTVSIAALRAFQEKSDISPKFVAGHSLGEFSALVASGSLELSDAVKITRFRGTYMQEAVEPGKGAMAAVIGEISTEQLNDICEAASNAETLVSPANLNAPTQVVISGHKKAVERASNALEDLDLRVIPLEVSAPFHSALMKPAADKLQETLNDFEFGDIRIPVVTNVEAVPNTEASRVRQLLVNQVTAPVRWVESMEYIAAQGIKTCIEFGPGNVLSGLMRRIDKKITVVSVNSTEGVDKAIASLEKL